MSNYNWPLSNINHNFLDRIKIASWVLNPKNRWSIDKETKRLEEFLAEQTKYRYVVATSSGSTANTLVGMWHKHKYENDFYKKNKVVVCAVGWSTTISPLIELGFEPVFLDSHAHIPTLDPVLLDDYLGKHKGEVAFVFFTTLLGIREGSKWGDGQGEIELVCEKHGVELYVDSCEETLKIRAFPLSHPTQTTSFYLAHEIQGLAECGAIFTNNEEEYHYYLSARNHGLTRHLPESKRKLVSNPKVHEMFDFNLVGNNFRPCEISSYAVWLDAQRWNDYIAFRKSVGKAFYSGDFPNYLLRFDTYLKFDVPFCLPIVVSPSCSNKEQSIDYVRRVCKRFGVETRSVVGGVLPWHTAFKKYNRSTYENAGHFHKYGLYVGVHKSMSLDLLEKFKEALFY